MTAKRKPALIAVRRATAYKRLAAKAWRASNSREAERYTRLAERIEREARGLVFDAAAHLRENMGITNVDPDFSPYDV